MIKATCEQCGKIYERCLSRIGRFCSRKCSSRSRRKRVKIICEHCGKLYETHPCFIKNRNHHFCSHSCSAKWRSENERGRNHPLWDRIEQKCAWCSQILQLPSNRINRTSNFFCSKKCKAMWWSENISGENHYNWKGGKSFEPYSIEFNEAFKVKVRTRDGYICAICKMFGNNVHHINYIKTDTSPFNCITLCSKCHTVTNYHRDCWQTQLTELMVVRLPVGARSAGAAPKTRRLTS